jgi:hypothetical protein
VKPIVLGPNQVQRSAGDHAPEDWVGSATSVFGEERTGFSALPDGRTAADAFAADPEAVFGPRHAERFRADPALLVKLLEAGSACRSTPMPTASSRAVTSVARSARPRPG